MSVAVDKARKNRSAAEIDHSYVRRSVTLHFCRRAHFLDARALDPNRAALDVAAFADIQQLSSLHEERNSPAALVAVAELPNLDKARALNLEPRSHFH